MNPSAHDVYLVDHGENGFNTLVLSGIDFVVPLEADLDGDPHQDDEVRLRSLDGRVERVLFASHADVEEDPSSPRFLYRFRDVPPGIYALSVRISGDNWAPVMAGILITTKDASWHGKQLGTALDVFQPAEAPPREANPEPLVSDDESEAC